MKNSPALDKPLRTEREAELERALIRADKLINWMAKHIGSMAPGSYHQCYTDLNEHGLFMQRNMGTKP